MLKIKQENGSWEDNPGKVRGLFERYFLDLFTTSGPREWGSVLDCLSTRVNVEMNETLTRPVTVEEVQMAALQMGTLKAPGPDEFQGVFYDTYWETIVANINSVILELMEGHACPS